MSNIEDQDPFNGYGIRVNLKTDFVKIREVLTRIGIANNKAKTLTQSCHIFHKRGQYALMHFKEMFLFDGMSSVYTDEDEARRNRIVKILEGWGMIEVLDDTNEDFPIASVNSVNIISRDLKNQENWKLIKKYTLGRSNKIVYT